MICVYGEDQLAVPLYVINSFNLVWEAAKKKKKKEKEKENVNLRFYSLAYITTTADKLQKNDRLLEEVIYGSCTNGMNWMIRHVANWQLVKSIN